MIHRDDPVHGAKGEVGHATGGTRHCTMSGCTGVRVGVRWPDGALTWPCTKGMTTNAAGEWEIPA